VFANHPCRRHLALSACFAPLHRSFSARETPNARAVGGLVSQPGPALATPFLTSWRLFPPLFPSSPLTSPPHFFFLESGLVRICFWPSSEWLPPGREFLFPLFSFSAALPASSPSAFFSCYHSACPFWFEYLLRFSQVLPLCCRVFLVFMAFFSQPSKIWFFFPNRTDCCSQRSRSFCNSIFLVSLVLLNDSILPVAFPFLYSSRPLVS